MTEHECDLPDTTRFGEYYVCPDCKRRWVVLHRPAAEWQQMLEKVVATPEAYIVALRKAMMAYADLPAWRRWAMTHRWYWRINGLLRQRR